MSNHTNRAKTSEETVRFKEQNKKWMLNKQGGYPTVCRVSWYRTQFCWVNDFIDKQNLYDTESQAWGHLVEVFKNGLKTLQEHVEKHEKVIIDANERIAKLKEKGK